MFCSNLIDAQEDRFRMNSGTKSCLTFVLPGSDNGSTRHRRRRKSFCGLQLDGFVGAMSWSSRTIAVLVDALRSGVMFPRAVDQTDLPVIAGLCVHPSFLIRKHWSPCSYFAQSFVAELFRQSFLRALTGTSAGTIEAQPHFGIVRQAVPVRSPDRNPADIIEMSPGSIARDCC